MTALEIKLAIGAAVLAVSLAAFAWYHHHVILEGEAKIEASDKAASAALQKLTDAQTAHNQQLATQAEQAATHEQQTVDDYAKSHPVGDVRVCHASNDSGGGLPQASPPHGGAQSAGAGSLVIPAVPDSAPGPNIGPGLTEIVLAAARMATIDAEWQRR